MKYFIVVLILGVSIFAFSATPVAAQCTTTVTGNSGDDPVYITGCTNISSSSTTIRKRANVRSRNIAILGSGGNTIVGGEDVINPGITAQGSTLTQSIISYINFHTINF